MSITQRRTIDPSIKTEWNLGNMVIIQFGPNCLKEKTEFYCECGRGDDDSTAYFELWFLDSEGKKRCPNFIKKINVCLLINHSDKRTQNRYIEGDIFINNISFEDSDGITRNEDDVVEIKKINELTYMNMKRTCFCRCSKIMDV